MPKILLIMSATIALITLLLIKFYTPAGSGQHDSRDHVKETSEPVEAITNSELDGKESQLGNVEEIEHKELDLSAEVTMRTQQRGPLNVFHDGRKVAHAMGNLLLGQRMDYLAKALIA